MLMGVAELDGDNIVSLYANAAVAKLLGLANIEVSNRTGEDMGNPPEENRIWVEQYRISQQTGEPVRFEYERPGPDHGQWLAATVTYLGTGSQGRPRFSFIAEDISERKHIEESLRTSREALRQSEARFRALVEPFAQVVWEADAAGMAVIDPHSWEAYTGQSPEEQAGDGWTDVIHPDDREKALHAWREALQNGTPLDTEYRLKSPDGEWRWTNVYATALRDGQGQVQKWVGMNVDITERKLAEMDLRASEAHQTFLLTLSDSLRSLTTPDAVETEACRILGEYLHADRVHYAEVEGDEVFIRHEYTLDVPFSIRRYRLSDLSPSVAQTFQREGTIVMHDMKTSPLVTAAERRTSSKIRVRAFIGTFLTRNGQWVAGMAVHSRQPRRWTAEEIAVVKAASERTWEAVERARANQALQNHNTLLSGINRIFDQVFRAQNEESVGRVCLRVAEEITGSKFGFLGKIDPQSGRFNAIAISESAWPIDQQPETVSDQGTTYTVYHSHPISTKFEQHSLFGRVLQSGRSFFTNAPQSDPDWIETPFGHQPLSAFLGVPLYYRGKVTGMIGLGNREGGYTPETQHLLEALVPSIVQALQSKRAEIALRVSEERFRRSIEALDEGFAILSAVREKPEGAGSAPGKVVDFRYEFVNQWVCDLYHRKPAEMIGRTTREVAPGHRSGPVYQLYLQVLETGQPKNAQLPFFSGEIAENSQVSGVFSLRVAKYGDGVIVTGSDVTEQVRLENEHQEAKVQMEIHHRLSEQREEERQSFARDIHDGPIQTLSSLSFQLQYLKETHSDPELASGLSDAILSVRGAVQELRQVMNELRTPQVIRFGLAKAIRLHADELGERYPHVTWHLTLDPDDNHLLPEATTLALYRIYQEAVNNILRHSGCSDVRVDYHVLGDHVALEIRDNGKGFSGKPDIIALTKAKHFGLAGISERVEALHGELEILSKPGKGTTIRVKAPVETGE
jgi:PAS domain S-box-containing protein